MIFQISPKLSVARDLPQTYRQTVPQTRPCNSKASVLLSYLLCVLDSNTRVLTLSRGGGAVKGCEKGFHTIRHIRQLIDIFKAQSTSHLYFICRQICFDSH